MFYINLLSFQAFSGFSHLQPHVLKHPGAPNPVPVYPPGYSKITTPSPSPDEDEMDTEGLSDTEEQSPVNGPHYAGSDEQKESSNYFIYLFIYYYFIYYYKC